MEAFKKFISENLKYPEEAIKNKIEGTVVIKYAIDYQGKVKDVKVIKGLGYGCDEEAIRVIKKLRFEIPKEPRKLRVLFHKENKLFFKLPDIKSTQKTETKSFQYTVITPKKDEVKKDDNTPKRYHYTINI